MIFTQISCRIDNTQMVFFGNSHDQILLQISSYKIRFYCNGIHDYTKMNIHHCVSGDVFQDLIFVQNSYRIDCTEMASPQYESSYVLQD